MAGMDEDSDESLLARIQGGDRQAFAILVRRHTNMFYAAAWRMCGHRQEAEDVVQDSFLKLWEKPQMWDSARGAKFTTWFYRIVTNRAIDTVRRRKPSVAAEVMEAVPDAKENQEESLFRTERQAMLEEAIQSLPERQKAALNLCFYEGLSNREAAEIMNVSVKALESLLIRAKTALKEHLSKNTQSKERRNRYA